MAVETTIDRTLETAQTSKMERIAYILPTASQFIKELDSDGKFALKHEDHIRHLERSLVRSRAQSQEIESGKYNKLHEISSSEKCTKI